MTTRPRLKPLLAVFLGFLPVLAGFAALSVAQTALAAPAPAPAQAVSFASLDGTALTALLLRPEGIASATVVALHGCGGLYARRGINRDSGSGQLNARHQAIGDLLVAQGYAVLFPDSLTARGEKELCTQKMGSRAITQTQRRSDALAALAWVAAQPWQVGHKIALLGWSHGGSAVLAATDAGRTDVRQAPKPALAVAFYPGCSAALKSGYQPVTRLVVMIGEKDDWTPAAPCQELGQRVGAEVNVYADSYYDFDNPIGGVTLRKDVPNGVNPGQGVHAGANPVAREQAYGRLLVLLRQALQAE